MKTAIIGAGKMGRWFTRFFLEQGDYVIVSSRSPEKLSQLKEFGVEIAGSVDAVRRADRVLICVPIENFEEVVKKIHSHVRPDQVIMDICSIKEIPVKIMHEHIKTGITLGTHPVFGPGAKNIRDQNFVLTPTTKTEEVFAQKFGDWLKEAGANVFVMSPRRHDELMSVVLGLPHFLGLVVCDTLLDYGNFLEAKRIAGASFRMLSMLAEAVASEETKFYASLQMKLPEIEKVEALFLGKSREWLDVVSRKDRAAFVDKMKLVKKRLNETNPYYVKSYQVMHKLLEAAKS